MQRNSYNYTYSYIQKFLIEKLQELCYYRSLDSYRAKVHNPLSSLKEIYHLIHDWNNNKIKDFNTVISSVFELQEFLKLDTSLNFGLTSKERLVDALNNLNIASKQQSEVELNKVLNQLEFEVSYILGFNKDYLEVLFNHTEEVLKGFPESNEDLSIIIPNLIKLDIILGFLITELINTSFSKIYLYKLINALFIYKKEVSFENRWQEFRTSLLSKTQQAFSIIFKINATPEHLEKLMVDNVVAKVPLELVGINPEKKILNFIRESNSVRFVIIDTFALDYYQALKTGKSVLSKILDRIHLGYSNLNLRIVDLAILITKNDTKKADLHPILYQIDGYYKSNPELFTSFLSNIQTIEENSSISYEVKDKINSALRHLRLGNEALEIEKKFVNYWIGLEYIFSSYDKDSNTFRRLKEFLPKTHIIYYVKRNLNQFHNDLNKYKSYHKDIEQREDLIYLSDVSIFDKVACPSYFEIHPLLSYRATRLKSHLHNNTEKRKNYLNKHLKNLEWHLIRLYRIRNELIHDAAIIEDIENLTGNLRYCLSFILNKAIEYFRDCEPKPINSKLARMDDFFQYHEMLWENLQKNKYPIEGLTNVPYSVDYLS